jgi:outer membrane protein X
MMKIFLMLGLFSWAGLAQAQDREFKPFKVDLAVGYAIPGGPGSSAGFVFALEPKYALMDQLSLGLRMEAALVARGLVSGASTEIKSITSYALTGDYYFSTNKSRFFAGLGAGLFQFGGTKVDITSNSGSTTVNSFDVASYTKFGVFPRIGAELGHFRVGVEYNVVPKQEVSPNSAFNNSYLSFKIGAFIGGGQY